MIDTLEKNRKKIVYSLFVLLFAISPFYYKANLGGTGLNLPYNITVWGAASTLILFSLMIVIIKKEIVFVDKMWMILSFPFLIIVSSFFSGYISASAWLIKQMFIFGGLLFLIALFQLRLKQQDIENILLLVVFSMIFHAGFGVFQIIHFGSAPPETVWRPSGILQQINVQASYLATGIIISFYLIALPSCSKRNMFGKAIIILAVALSSFVLSYSGSRIGILSLLIGLPLLIVSHRKDYLKNRNMFALTLVILVLGVFFGRSGLGIVANKGHELINGGYADLRVVIYAISMNIVQAEFIYGHGLGGFIKAWSQYAPQFYASHPDVQNVPHIAHPHNELLMWFIETGILGIVGIFLFIWKVLVSLLKCGWKNGLGYLSMLIPISFHTQVELPFYISSPHWFLWLFLIFMVLKAGGINTNKAMPAFSLKLIAVPVVLYGFVMLFIYNSEMARRDLYNTMKSKPVSKDTYPLQVALNSLYFQNEAERLVMRFMLAKSIKNNDKQNMKTYIGWSTEYVKVWPELKVLEDMSEAYRLLSMKQEKCQIVKEGLYIYGASGILSKNAEGC